MGHFGAKWDCIMTYEWKQVEKRHTILIGGFCVILYEEEWTLGQNSGIYIARCAGITPDPFRVLERDLDEAKESALRQVLACVDVECFNLQAFHDNLTKMLERKAGPDGSA